MFIKCKKILMSLLFVFCIVGFVFVTVSCSPKDKTISLPRYKIRLIETRNDTKEIEWNSLIVNNDIYDIDAISFEFNLYNDEDELINQNTVQQKFVYNNVGIKVNSQSLFSDFISVDDVDIAREVSRASLKQVTVLKYNSLFGSNKIIILMTIAVCLLWPAIIIAIIMVIKSLIIKQNLDPKKVWERKLTINWKVFLFSVLTFSLVITLYSLVFFNWFDLIMALIIYWFSIPMYRILLYLISVLKMIKNPNFLRILSKEDLIPINGTNKIES